jgi:hypothetical protein
LIAFIIESKPTIGKSFFFGNALFAQIAKSINLVYELKISSEIV